MIPMRNMNKDKLQQELLEKVREGIKPSDLKKPQQKQKPSPKPPKKPYQQKSIVPTVPIGTNQKNPILNQAKEQPIPTPPPLPNQNLSEKIKALHRQIQVYQDFKEADLKIKEGYKKTIADLTEGMRQLQAKIEQQDKTIADLQNQVKTTADINPELN